MSGFSTGGEFEPFLGVVASSVRRCARAVSDSSLLQGSSASTSTLLSPGVLFGKDCALLERVGNAAQRGCHAPGILDRISGCALRNPLALDESALHRGLLSRSFRPFAPSPFVGPALSLPLPFGSAAIDRSLALIGELFTPICTLLTMVCGPLALVCNPIALICDPVALVRDLLAPLGDLYAPVRDPFLHGRSRAIPGGPLSARERGSFSLQGLIVGLEPRGTAHRLLLTTVDLGTNSRIGLGTQAAP